MLASKTALTIYGFSVQEKKEAMEPWPHQYGYHLACEMLMFTIGKPNTTLSEPLNAFSSEDPKI